MPQSEGAYFYTAVVFLKEDKRSNKEFNILLKLTRNTGVRGCSAKSGIIMQWTTDMRSV